MVWEDDWNRPCDPYHLDVSKVLKKSAETGECLRRLGDSYRNVRGDYTEILKELAASGFRLRNALFEDGLPQERQRMEDAREWFESWAIGSQDAIEMQVSIAPHFQIPWGVLHDIGPTTSNPTGLYDQFWAIKYNVSGCYNAFRAPKSDEG